MVILTEIAKQYPPILLSQYAREVLKVTNQLKDHKKRVVRKMTRTTINEWSMIA